MLRVKNRSGSPLGGYTFTDPTTKTKFHAWYLGKLFALVQQHRVANKLPLGPNIAQEVEQAICNERPELCNEVGLNLLQMGGDFAKAMWRWGKSGFAVVSSEVFEERKNTCLSCPSWKGYRDIGVGYCSECGCASGRVSIKQWMATEKCPKSKWKS